MKKLLLLTLFLSLSPLKAMEPREVSKPSLWDQTKLLFYHSLQSLKIHINPTYHYLTHSSSFRGLIKEAGKRKARKSMCYTATLPELPYLEDFPIYEPGNALIHTRYLKNFIQHALLQQQNPLGMIEIILNQNASVWRKLGSKTFFSFFYAYLKIKSLFLKEGLKATAQEICPIITTIIENEIRHPGYQSFFHGSTYYYSFICELYKQLYHLGSYDKTQSFEQLRVPKGRMHLKKISKETYFTQSPNINDDKEPYRTDLLAITYLPWHQNLLLYTGNFPYNSFDLNLFARQALTAYKLPIPKKINRTKIVSYENHPDHKRGVLFHILLEDTCAQKISYEAWPFGAPVIDEGSPIATCEEEKRGTIFSPEETRTHLREEYLTEGRLILDPTFFDTPHKDVIIYRFQEKTTEEKAKKWAHKIIEKARTITN